ncbi:MAG: HNH endonuclease [Paludibacteraceae bacterium]|nr:HNH endonuclease [Paludibacteraceae bacterium]
MNILGENFKVKDVFNATLTVPDCFVKRQNKIGEGNGEAKLYVANKDVMRQFYGGEGFNAKCFILKQDLLAYMYAMETEYKKPSQDYHQKENLPQLWQERIQKINSLPNIIEFYIKDQTQIQGPRGYVNSYDEAYQLIRELSLPLVSYISALQLVDKFGQIIYYWKLFADFEAIADKRTALVYTYGKKVTIDARRTTKKEIHKNEEIRKARIGQGKYREALLLECPFCPITMINDERLLIASHIKPWAVSTDTEKIDSKNGFMLSPLYDKLFDRGFITFTNDRKILISNWLSPQNVSRLGIKENQFVQLLPMDDQRKAYLQFHRNSVFKG